MDEEKDAGCVRFLRSRTLEELQMIGQGEVNGGDTCGKTSFFLAARFLVHRESPQRGWVRLVRSSSSSSSTSSSSSSSSNSRYLCVLLGMVTISVRALVGWLATNFH